MPPEEQKPGATTDACTDTTLVFDFDNPETAGVRERESARWRFDGAAYTVVEHSPGVYQIDRHPSPASTLAIFAVRTDNGRPAYSARVLVDMATGEYRVLGANYVNDPRYVFAWLPLDWLAWIDDQGEVYAGSIATQKSFDAPARMTNLWLVAPDQLLTRDDAYQFWSVDRVYRLWYPALLPGESEKITTRWVENAAVSDDGRTVFFFYQDYSAILTIDSGTVEILTPADLPPDGYYSTWLTEPFVPPQPIKDTPYWFLGSEGVFREIAHVTYVPRSTTIASTELTYPSLGFVVDSRTGAVIGHETLGIPVELAIHRSYLSPDRTRLAVEVVEAIETLGTNAPRVAQTWFYTFPAGEPQRDHVAEGAFAGWESDSQAELTPSLSCSEQEIRIALPLPTPPLAATAPPLNTPSPITLTPAPLEPVLTAARVFPFSWSPDSNTLAYWIFSQEEVAAGYMLPAGELYFYDVQTGESCRSPIRVAYGYDVPTLVWLANGRA